MKRLMWAALLALPLSLAVGARAEADNGCGGCLNLQGGFRIKICYAGYLKACTEPFSYCNPCGGGHGGGGNGGGPGGGGGLAPWYLYWPMEAHYQVPAPTGYPYWPSAMTPPPTWGYTPSPAPAHGGHQQVGYFGNGYGAPSYWYGH